MYPAVVGGLNPWENQQQMNYGAGIYAVPVLPCTGIFSNTYTTYLQHSHVSKSVPNH